MKQLSNSMLDAQQYQLLKSSVKEKNQENQILNMLKDWQTGLHMGIPDTLINKALSVAMDMPFGMKDIKKIDATNIMTIKQKRKKRFLEQIKE